MAKSFFAIRISTPKEHTPDCPSDQNVRWTPVTSPNDKARRAERTQVENLSIVNVPLTAASGHHTFNDVGDAWMHGSLIVVEQPNGLLHWHTAYANVSCKSLSVSESSISQMMQIVTSIICSTRCRSSLIAPPPPCKSIHQSMLLATSSVSLTLPLGSPLAVATWTMTT